MGREAAEVASQGAAQMDSDGVRDLPQFVTKEDTQVIIGLDPTPGQQRKAKGCGPRAGAPGSARSGPGWQCRSAGRGLRDAWIATASQGGAGREPVRQGTRGPEPEGGLALLAADFEEWAWVERRPRLHLKARPRWTLMEYVTYRNSSPRRIPKSSSAWIRRQDSSGKPRAAGREPERQGAHGPDPDGSAAPRAEDFETPGSPPQAKGARAASRFARERAGRSRRADSPCWPRISRRQDHRCEPKGRGPRAEAP